MGELYSWVVSMEDKVRPSDLWSGALIGVGLVILQGLFSLNCVDPAAFISIIAFAIAIPILSCNLLTNFLKKKYSKKSSDQIWEILFYGGGVLAALVGFGAAFWRASWISAVVFVVSSVFALVVFIIVRKSI